MFFIQFRVRPADQSSNALEYGGAYANCWVECDALSDARTAALAQIHEAGWEVKSVEQERLACRGDFDRDGVRYFDQAIIDKTVCVFHTWPIDAPDADHEQPP